jgi:hypothetical protein
MCPVQPFKNKKLIIPDKYILPLELMWLEYFVWRAMIREE